MLATTWYGQLIGYSAVIAVWALIFWLIVSNRLRWGSDSVFQSTWIYCPVCNNELVADEKTICVDQLMWQNKGEDPDELTEEWHKRLGGHGQTLSEYLGLTPQQYAVWVAYPPVNDIEVIYRCGKCNAYSAWDFDAPAPILLRHRTNHATV